MGGSYRKELSAFAGRGISCCPETPPGLAMAISIDPSISFSWVCSPEAAALVHLEPEPGEREGHSLPPPPRWPSPANFPRAGLCLSASLYLFSTCFSGSLSTRLPRQPSLLLQMLAHSQPGADCSLSICTWLCPTCLAIFLTSLISPLPPAPHRSCAYPGWAGGFADHNWFLPRWG